MGNNEIVLQDIITCVPKCWTNEFCLKKAGNRSVVCEHYDSHMRCPNSTNAKYMERNSFAYIDNFVCLGLNVLESNAIGAYVLRLDWSFWLRSLLRLFTGVVLELVAVVVSTGVDVLATETFSGSESISWS